MQKESGEKPHRDFQIFAPRLPSVNCLYRDLCYRRVGALCSKTLLLTTSVVSPEDKLYSAAWGPWKFPGWPCCHWVKHISLIGCSMLRITPVQQPSFLVSYPSAAGRSRLGASLRRAAAYCQVPLPTKIHNRQLAWSVPGCKQRQNRSLSQVHLQLCSSIHATPIHLHFHKLCSKQAWLLTWMLLTCNQQVQNSETCFQLVLCTLDCQRHCCPCFHPCDLQYTVQVLAAARRKQPPQGDGLKEIFSYQWLHACSFENSQLGADCHNMWSRF